MCSVFLVPCSLFCAGLCPGAQGNVDGMEFIVVYNPLFICVYGMGGLIRMLEREREIQKKKIDNNNKITGCGITVPYPMLTNWRLGLGPGPGLACFFVLLLFFFSFIPSIE